MYGVVTVSTNDYGRIIVSFQYDPGIVNKVKTIEGRKGHPAERYTRVSTKSLCKIRSPMDSIDLKEGGGKLGEMPLTKKEKINEYCKKRGKKTY